MLVVAMLDAARETHDQDQTQKNRPDQHVAGVQPDQRIERRAEEIGADCEPFMVYQMHPFIEGPEYESNAGGERDKPPQMEPPNRTFLQMMLGRHDRSTAAEQ